MSSSWSWYIIILTIFNIVAVWWLLIHFSKGKKASSEEDSNTTGHVWDDDLRELNNPLPRWWMWLFHITVVFGIVYLILYPGLGNFSGVLAWSQDKQYMHQIEQADKQYSEIYQSYLQQDIADLAKNDSALRTGHRIFTNTCSTCHGSDARGAYGFPNLKDSEWLYGNAAAAIKQSITQGRSGNMPAWGVVLGEQGVKNMVAYIQQISDQAYDAELARAGQQQYQTFCLACHGPEGKGNPAFGAPDLTNDIWLYGGDVAALTESITNGRTGKMPAHKTLLNEGKIHVLTAYVYSFATTNAD